MVDVTLPLRRPAHPDRAQGRYQRTVDALDESALAECTKHYFGVGGLCVAHYSAHYNFSPATADVDASELLYQAFEYGPHPSGRQAIFCAIVQVSTSRSTVGSLTVTLFETSAVEAMGLPAPDELDRETGVVFTAGVDIDRTQQNGDPPYRFIALPVIDPGDADETDPDRMMTYQPLVDDDWADGYPSRIEVRMATEGVRIHHAAIIEYPMSIIEGTAL